MAVEVGAARLFPKSCRPVSVLGGVAAASGSLRYMAYGESVAGEERAAELFMPRAVTRWRRAAARLAFVGEATGQCARRACVAQSPALVAFASSRDRRKESVMLA